MTPEEKAAFRWAFARDAKTIHESMIHDFHAAVAENRLQAEGVKPELVAYVNGIGEGA